MGGTDPQTGSSVPTSAAASGETTTLAPTRVRINFVRFPGHGPTERQSIGRETFRYYVDGALVRELSLYEDGHVDLLLQAGHPAELELLGTRATIELVPIPSIDTDAGRRKRLTALGYLAPSAPRDGEDEGYVARLMLGRAIYAFQIDHGLSASGNFDDATVARLRELCGEA